MIHEKKSTKGLENYYEDWKNSDMLAINWRSLRQNIFSRISFKKGKGLYLEGVESYENNNIPSFLNIQQQSYEFKVYLTVDTMETIGSAGLLMENSSDIFVELLFQDKIEIYFRFYIYGMQHEKRVEI